MRVLTRPPSSESKQHNNHTTMSTSHYSSRPAQTDVGADTIRITRLDNPPQNTARNTNLTAALWMLAGCLLLVCDGLALAHFANDPVEACILAALCMPTGLFVVAAAFQARLK